MLDHSLVHFPKMGCQGDGSIAAQLFPRFAVFVDGDNNGVFPPSGNCALIPASLEEAQQNLQERLGDLLQHLAGDGVHPSGVLDFPDGSQGSS